MCGWVSVEPSARGCDAWEMRPSGVTRSDAAAVRLAAHTLKSSSAWLGAHTLSALARQAEQLASEERLAEVAPPLTPMLGCFDALAAELKARRDEVLQSVQPETLS